RTLAARIVGALGEAGAFPDAARIAGAGEARLGALGVMPARARTLVALARGVDAGEIALERGADPEPAMAALERVPGIGPWTASYVAMRALRWPDALPAGDLVLRRGLDERSDAGVRARAEAWRPWRAYGVMHVWAGAKDGAR